MIVKNYFISLLTLLLSAAIYATGMTDTPALSKRVRTVNTFNRYFPQEKVYLHIDNTGYFIGETIWFKAYVLRTDNDSLDSKSRILYVELVDPAGNVAATKKYKIVNGEAHGDFALANLPISGFYEIRAYTRYMLNWGGEAIFSRVIPIFKSPERQGDYAHRVMEEDMGAEWLPSKTANASRSDDIAGTISKNDTDNRSSMTVRFYPEGGNLIKGLQSRIAFEVIGKGGRALDAKGWLMQDGKKIKEVKTLREGRGIFDFIPQEKSKLIINTDDGKCKTYDLPSSLSSGCVLTVDASAGSTINTSVSASPDLAGREMALVFIHNGKIYRHTEFVTGYQPWHDNVERKEMHDGVNQMTLMDAEGNIYANRMVFIYPHHDIDSIGITSADSLSWPGKLIALDVKTKPMASLSLSVCDAQTQTGADRHNAATWLMLTSDLRGYINNPEYYLEKDDDTHRAAADLLMMVQGWRRYDVSCMNGKNTFVRRYPVEDRLYIDGKLYAYRKKNTVDGVNLGVTLSNMYGDILAGNAVTDSTGNYAFEMPDCYRDWNMLMRTTKGDKAKTYYVSINRHFSPQVTAMAYGETHNDCPIIPNFSYALSADYANMIPMDVREHWLKNVDVKGKRIWKNPREFWERESRGAKNAFVRYNCQKAADGIADLGQPVPSLIEWLLKENADFKGNDNISGCFRHDNFANNFHADGLTYRGRPIIWIVDNRFVCGTGMTQSVRTKDEQIDDLSALNTQFPVLLDDAKSVYVSARADDWKRFMIAPQLEGRHYVTVYVYTFEKPLNIKMKGLRITHFSGYSVPEDYNQMMTLNNLTTEDADYRRTLYWNPDLKTDAAGNAHIMFKNNSTCRYITVSAEGFTRNGQALVFDK